MELQWPFASFAQAGEFDSHGLIVCVTTTNFFSVCDTILGIVLLIEQIAYTWDDDYWHV